MTEELKWGDLLPGHLKDVFKNHKATHYILRPGKTPDHRPEIEALEWREPGNSTYAIWYVRWWGTLMVFGDCYEATYQWTGSDPSVTLEWIAGLNQDYFVSKCRASQHGRNPRFWDHNTARDYMKKHFEYLEEEDPEYEDLEEGETPRAKFQETGGWDSLESEAAWLNWAWSHGDDVFGQDWWEAVDMPGMTLDVMIPLHLAGLRAAFNQLRTINDEQS